MDRVAGGLIAANLLLSAWLLWRQLVLRRALRTAEAAIAAAGAATPIPPQGVIGVEVLNAMELAVRDSRLARAFGTLTPELVRREVYKVVARRMAAQLQDEGVVAEIKIHDRAGT